MTRDVVVVMVSDTYSDSVRRGFYSTADQTILSLLDCSEIGRVMVADHPRGVLSQVRRRWRGDRPAPRAGRLRGVRPITIATPTPISWSAIHRRYMWYDRQIELASRCHGLRDPTIVNFNLFHAAVGSPWARQSVFYAQDDESSLAHRSAYRNVSRRAYSTIDESPCSVVAVSETLLERVAPTQGGTVIANGVDPALWSTIPPANQLSSNPLAVYAGTIDARVDVTAFLALADHGYAVRMVGAVADVDTARALRKNSSIELVGSVSREAVVRELVQADVCVLAHQRTALTQAMSPLKLFEYLASGTPTVATSLTGILDGLATLDGIAARSQIVTVPEGGNYTEAAERALSIGRLGESDRRDLVKQMSWRSRHKTLIDLIEL